MTRWADIRAEVPDFADEVEALFRSGTNKTMATLRADGSPRISGTELEIDDDVTLGMMPDSRKLHDVLRDARVAIHSPTLEPPKDPAAWVGEAKLAGRLVSIPPSEKEPPGSSSFALDVTEVVHTRLDETATYLVVRSWHPGRGLTELRRK